MDTGGRGRFAGKTALVTGAAAGIGAATAFAFAREGARVALVDVDAGGAADVAARIAERGGEAAALPADIGDDRAVSRAVSACVEAFGALHVAFNCAGGSDQRDSHLVDVDLSLWEKTMRVNLLGTMLVCRHSIPHIAAAGGGAIVNMSSGAALRGGSPKHIYTASKGAIVSLTRALAGAHAHQNIRVNAICSGRVLTERIVSSIGTPGAPGPIVDRQDAAGRVKEYPFWVGRPEDIAAIALFLASDESRMITGASIPADGGRSAY